MPLARTAPAHIFWGDRQEVRLENERAQDRNGFLHSWHTNLSLQSKGN